MPQGKTHLGKMPHKNEDSFEPSKLNTNVSMTTGQLSNVTGVIMTLKYLYPFDQIVQSSEVHLLPRSEISEYYGLPL